LGVAIEELGVGSWELGRRGGGEMGKIANYQLLTHIPHFRIYSQRAKIIEESLFYHFQKWY
jgi:hypothetical protein